jgi:phosphate transport system protein
MPPLLEERLKKQLKLILGKVVEMGIRAEAAVEGSLKALTEGNRPMAYSIILRDQVIDNLEKEIDRLCLEFLVRHQPVASHLRFAYATIKINTGLERVGDYAESIARQVLFMNPREALPLKDRFIEIGELSIKMLHDAIESFVQRDAGLARRTMHLESRVDHIREDIRSQLLPLHRDKGMSLETANAVLISSGRFERVADQAANICEEVLYLCTGEVVKHQDSDIFRVLFVSKGNSTRSQMAEGIANSLDLEQFLFSSAGSDSHSIDPRTEQFMAEKGIDISAHETKTIEQVPNLEHYQVIIFLSKEAEDEIDRLPAKAVTMQWLTPDPSKFGGSEEEIKNAYERTFDYLDSNIRDFVQAVLGNGLYP